MAKRSQPLQETSRDQYRPLHMNEEEERVWDAMSSKARKELQDMDLRMRPIGAAEKMWDRLLTVEQRQSLGVNFEAAFKTFRTLGMWMQVKGFTNRFAALADFSKALSSRDWLVQQSNLVVGQERPPLVVPHWNPQTGELSFNGRPIRRKVRRFRYKSNVQRILDAFQNAGWPSTIRSPLRRQTALHQALHSLNASQTHIRFSGGDGATTISWRLGRQKR